MSTFDCTVRGPYSRARVAAFLDDTVVPMRLAVQTAGKFPVLLSLWFAREGDTLVAAVHRDAKIVRRLRDNPHCAFEVALNAPPYRGVRGQATVQLDAARGGEVLERLLQRYLGSLDSRLARWLLSRRSEELALVLEPVNIESWDYGDRMSDAVPPEATRH
ncbi:MAG: pyridoxamine 5'-phosphate oxidase family protein [Sandaracinaceae bacterium]|nr:pyridoxamine 5'-phosphate oxidase family protein [Sandaracinaceae bacterium]